MSAVKVKEPTEPGWYAYSGGAQSMIFLRTRKSLYRGGVAGRWWVVFDNGSISGCDWGYICRYLETWDLVRIDVGAQQALRHVEAVLDTLDGYSKGESSVTRQVREAIRGA